MSVCENFEFFRPRLSRLKNEGVSLVNGGKKLYLSLIGQLSSLYEKFRESLFTDKYSGLQDYKRSQICVELLSLFKDSAFVISRVKGISSFVVTSEVDCIKIENQKLNFKLDF